MAFLDEAMVKIRDLPADVVAARVASAWLWQNIVQRGWICYVLSGFLEESIKCYPIVWTQEKVGTSKGKEMKSECVRYAIASGLGFNLAKSMIVARMLFARSGWSEMVLAMGEQVILETIVHVLMTALSGIRLSRLEATSTQTDKQKRLSWKKWIQIIGPSALYRGTMEFVLRSISAMNGELA